MDYLIFKIKEKNLLYLPSASRTNWVMISNNRVTAIWQVSLDKNQMAKFVKDIFAISTLLNYLEDVWDLLKNDHYQS